MIPPHRLPVKSKPLKDQAAFIIASMTLFGEARGECYQAMKAVACVIRNRVALAGWMGKTIKQVCLKPKQFSCFEDHNLDKMWEPQNEEDAWLSCLQAVQEVFIGNVPDITFGATHYYDVSLDKKKQVPQWTNGAEMTVQIGKLKFFKGVK